MLITNFKNEQLPKYRKALETYKEQTNDKDLYIDRNAYSNGYKQSDLSALRCNSFKELSEFWEIFDSLEQ